MKAWPMLCRKLQESKNCLWDFKPHFSTAQDPDPVDRQMKQEPSTVWGSQISAPAEFGITLV